jgi:hypothetical protein
MGCSPDCSAKTWPLASSRFPTSNPATVLNGRQPPVIKVADLISNTASIVLHDPKFAQVYIPEAQQMIDVLTRADDRLREVASQQLSTARAKLQEGVA